MVLEREIVGIQRPRTPLDGDEAAAAVDTPDDVSRCSGRMPQVQDKPRERLVLRHRVGRVEFAPMAPCPILDDIEAAVPQSWKECFEGRPSRPEARASLSD